MRNLKIFIINFFIGIITYGYSLTNFTLTVDNETPIYPDFSLGLGRWGTNLIRYHLFNGHTHYFTLLFSLLLLSISSVIFTRIFKFNKYSALSFAAIFMSVPQMAYQLVFTMQADVIGIGFLISAVLMYYFLNTTSTENRALYLAKFIVYAVAIMFIIALYQGLILLPITIFLLYLFLKVDTNEYSIKDFVRKSLEFALIVIVGAIFYIISVKIICPSGQGGFMASYLSGDNSFFSPDIFSIVLKNLVGNHFYGNKTTLFMFLAVLFTLYSSIRSKENVALKILLLLAILLIPYSFSFLIKNGYHPPRLYIPLGIIMAFMVTYVINKLNKPNLLLYLTLVITTCNVYFITNLFLSSNQIYNHDLKIGNKINTLIETKYPEFDATKHYVYFHGALSYDEHEKFRLPDSEIFGGSLFCWDNGNNFRIINFFSYTDIAYYKMLENTTQLNQAINEASKLQSWPSENSISKVDDIIVVKLGNEKGSPLHFE